jgi:hypothetical protein
MLTGFGQGIVARTESEETATNESLWLAHCSWIYRRHRCHRACTVVVLESWTIQRQVVMTTATSRQTNLMRPILAVDTHQARAYARDAGTAGSSSRLVSTPVPSNIVHRTISSLAVAEHQSHPLHHYASCYLPVILIPSWP